MKKKFGLTFVVGMVALLMVCIYVLGFADMGTSNYTAYGLIDSKVNYTLCFEEDSSDVCVPSYADYPADLIALEEVEAETSVVFDLHYYTQMTTWLCITDREADTGHVNVALEVSKNQTTWALADTLNGSAADSTCYVKDWAIPAGSVYGRIIYRAQSAAGDSSSVQQISHCFQQ